MEAERLSQGVETSILAKGLLDLVKRSIEAALPGDLQVRATPLDGYTKNIDEG
jgi:hypothetical protein